MKQICWRSAKPLNVFWLDPRIASLANPHNIPIVKHNRNPLNARPKVHKPVSHTPFGPTSILPLNSTMRCVQRTSPKTCFWNKCQTGYRGPYYDQGFSICLTIEQWFSECGCINNVVPIMRLNQKTNHIRPIIPDDPNPTYAAHIL